MLDRGFTRVECLFGGVRLWFAQFFVHGTHGGVDGASDDLFTWFGSFQANKPSKEIQDPPFFSI